MKKVINISIWMVTVIFLNMGCGETKKETLLRGGPLKNTAWILVKFPGHDIKDLKPTLNFESEKLHGTAVCNYYSATYGTDANEITFGLVASTRKMCAERNKLENALLKQFSETNSYGVKGDKLILKNALGILEFKRVHPTKEVPILSEDTLGVLPLNMPFSQLEKGLAKLFPQENIRRTEVHLEDSAYDQITVESKNIILKGTLLGNPQRLESLEIVTDKIKDSYEVKEGMPFHELKMLRSDIEITTDPHFHTYASAPDSNIKYEICCNTNGPDKEDWSIGEVQEWKVTSIIWENKQR